MIVESINLSHGDTLVVGNKTISSGIFKHPQPGSIFIDIHGVVGDAIIQTDDHGGVDQAVYLYHQEDYQWWEKELGYDLSPGQFGENLTLRGLSEIDFNVGDRLQINDIILELTAPRIPCATLAARMGDTHFLKQFVRANRAGVLARVIQTGTLAKGDNVHFIASKDNYPTLKDIFHQRHTKSPDASLLRRAISSPMSEKLRPNLQARLESLTKKG